MRLPILSNAFNSELRRFYDDHLYAIFKLIYNPNQYESSVLQGNFYGFVALIKGDLLLSDRERVNQRHNANHQYSKRLGYAFV